MNKSLKITYYAVTILFSAFMLVDGIAGLMRIPEGQEIMEHLGYPVYILSILGAAKVLGAIGILQNRFSLMKEWAYAGFTFHFLGAAASRAFAGDSLILIISPLLFMSIMFISYFLWKPVQRVRREKVGETADELAYI